MVIEPSSPEGVSKAAKRNDESRRALVRALRVGCYAAAARILLGLVKAVLLQRTLHPRRIADAVLTLDPAKWACVVGGWAVFPALRAAIAAALHAVIRAIPKAARPDTSAIENPRGSIAEHAATIAAGALAAAPILVMNVATRTELGLYLATRALHGAAVVHLLPVLPRCLRDFEHWDVVGVGASGGQILYCLAFAPHSHSPAYASFLLRCVFRTRAHLAAVSGAFTGQLLPATMELAERLHKPEPLAAVDASWALPGGVRGNAAFVVNHMARFAVPLYLPLKVGLGVVLHGPRVVRDPVMFIAATVRSTLWSSLFLTLYCAGPLAILRMMAERGIAHGGLIWLMCAVACAPPTFFEPKGRRLSLALYCQMHAMRTARLLLYIRGYARRPTRHEVLAMYVASVVFLFHQNTHMPETLHSNLVQGFQFLFGASAKPTAAKEDAEHPELISPPTESD